MSSVKKNLNYSYTENRYFRQLKASFSNSTRLFYWWQFFLFLIFLVTPLLIYLYPPLVDLPQHVRQVDIAMDLLRGGHSSIDYKVELISPYAFVYYILIALSFFLPTLFAFKLVFIAYFALSLVALQQLTRETTNSFKLSAAIVFVFFFTFLIPILYNVNACISTCSFIIASVDFPAP